MIISDAYRFTFPLLVLAAPAAYFGFPTIAVVLLLTGAFVLYFFRNPRRSPPPGEGLIVSPADGHVVAIAPADTDVASGGGHAISIFLSIFDVHVNRSPISGVLSDLEYRRGKFKVAFAPEASAVNEMNVLTIRGDKLEVVVRQIAGLIARRVVCWKKPGERLERGELFGLIRFGSRVDVLLPVTVAIRCKVGDRVKGGTSVLGEVL